MNEQNSSTPNGGLLSRLMSGKTPQPEFNAENFRKLFCETFNITLAGTSDKEGKAELDKVIKNLLQTTGLGRVYEFGYTASLLAQLVQNGHLNLYDCLDALHKTAIDIDLDISDAESIIYNAMSRALRDTSNNKKGDDKDNSNSTDDKLNLDRDLTTLPKLPLECLPSLVRTIVENVAECQRIDPWIPFAAIVKNAAGIIGSNYYYISDNYVTPAHFWLLLVAKSGNQKSGVTDFISEPLREYQKKINAEYNESIDEYDDKLEVWEEERRLAKQQNLKFTKQKPTKPTENLIYDDDYTPEKLFFHLVDNPGGILIDVDEFSTWIKSMDRYNKGSSEKSLTISMYKGAQKQRARVGDRKTYIVPHAWISVYATTQPDTLATLIKKEDLTNGFAVRFSMICPQKPNDRKKRREVLDLKIDRNSIFKLIETMLSWPRLNHGKNALTDPVELTLDDDAKLRLADILDGIECIEGISDKYSGELISRYLEQFARFVLIMHCLESASNGLSSPAPTINITTVENAKKIFYAMMSHSAYAWSIILKAAVGKQPEVEYLTGNDIKLIEIIDTYLDKSSDMFKLKYATKGPDGKPLVECLAADLGIDTSNYAKETGIANSIKGKITKTFVRLGFIHDRDQHGVILMIAKEKFEKLKHPT
ncbi:DUF3987 domain-containing protein [bacterium]|nr:DUF3987 domain-containing protein [bacterium]